MYAGKNYRKCGDLKSMSDIQGCGFLFYKLLDGKGLISNRIIQKIKIETGEKCKQIPWICYAV